MASYDVVSGDSSVLAAKINSTQTTGIQVAPMTINGSTVAWGNSAGVLEISESVEGSFKREWISYTSVSTASDSTVTLAGVSRDVSRSASSLTGSGTGQSFNKGASVKFVDFHYLYNQKANIDRANTWTAAQTISTAGSITPTNTTTPVYHGQRLTTTQRDALTGVVNGDWIYNTTADQTQWYEGGSWVSNGAAGSVANGSTTVAGKFEEATVAEQGSATATGGSGARLVLAAANLVTSSAGAGDANKISVLNGSGLHPVVNGGTGAATLTANNVILGNGTSAVQFVAPSTSGNVLTSDGSTWASTAIGTTVPVSVIANTSDVGASTTSEVTAVTYTIPANSVAVGDTFEMTILGTMRVASVDGTVRARIGGSGGNLLGTVNFYATGGTFGFKATIYMVVRTIGSGGTVVGGLEVAQFMPTSGAGTSTAADAITSTVVMDTTASKDLVLTFQPASSQANTAMRASIKLVKKYRPTATS